MSYSQHEYDSFEWPKLCPPKAFAAQVKRTINGEPIGEEQAMIIMDAIAGNMSFAPNDVLLDLCCGNGYLADPFAKKIKGYVGVDYSPVLIDIAEKNFAVRGTQSFVLDGVGNFTSTCSNPELFTKALCYGAFCYLSPDEASQLLTNLYKIFINIKLVFIGTIADKERVKDFFYEVPQDFDFEDHQSKIGKWYSRDEFVMFAKKCGWRAEIVEKDHNSYQAHYRFDALLTRKD